MRDLADRLLSLRREVAGLACRERVKDAGLAPLGHDDIDSALGGGLARGHLHELFATEPEDASSAAGFAAMLSRRLAGDIVWVRQGDAEARAGALHAPGLLEIGIDPSCLILCRLRDPTALLKAAAEAVRCNAIGVVVIEMWRMPRVLDLTASRRLALAAEASGVTVLMLRIQAEAIPSAAWTRWSVAAAASRPIEAGAPGHPALSVELVRQRGRPAGGRWLVEWDRERACFRPRTEASSEASGAVFPASPDGPASRLRRIA